MYSVIIVAAGQGKRSGLSVNKVLYEINGKPLIQYVLEFFKMRKNCKEIIVAVHESEAGMMRERFCDLATHIVVGGATRQDSVYNGAFMATSDTIIIHDAARPLLSHDVLDRLESALKKHPAISTSIPVVDTLKYVDNGKITNHLERDNVYHMQTPQGFKRSLWLEAYQKTLQQKRQFTCDASLVQSMTKTAVYTVLGERGNIKLTTPEDIHVLSRLLKKEGDLMIRIGHSKDIHRLEEGTGLILGGLTIDADVQSVGHSDADCLLHTVAEALYGALGEGDLGSHFPDTDTQYKNLPSTQILKHANEKLTSNGYQLENLDATIFLEKPKLAPTIDAIRTNVATLLGVSHSRINIKAATWEGLDSIGKRQSIMCETVVLIKKRGDKQ